MKKGINSLRREQRETKNLVNDFAHHVSQKVSGQNVQLVSGTKWMRLPLGYRKIRYWVIPLGDVSSFISFYPSNHLSYLVFNHKHLTKKKKKKKKNRFPAKLYPGFEINPCHDKKMLCRFLKLRWKICCVTFLSELRKYNNFTNKMTRCIKKCSFGRTSPNIGQKSLSSFTDQR